MRREVISATSWKIWSFFSLRSCLRCIICFFLWTRPNWLAQRVYQWWHAVYSCWQNRGLWLCMRPTGSGQAQTAASRPTREKKQKTFPIFLGFSSVPVSQLYMFNELASFLTLYPSSPSLLRHFLHAFTCFFLFQFFSCWHSQSSRKD